MNGQDYQRHQKTVTVGAFKCSNVKYSQEKGQPDQSRPFNLIGSNFARISGAQKYVNEEKGNNKYNNHC